MPLRLFLLTILFGILAGIAGFFVFVNPHTLRGGGVNRRNAELILPSPGKFIPDQDRSAGQARLDSAGQAFLLPLSEVNYLPIRDFTVPEPILSAEAAVLFDMRSGRFLYSKNINQQLPIASITKLMSAVVALENLNLNEIFTIPVENINVDGQGADFRKNEQVYGIDLFRIMLIESSNDAALTFATVGWKKGIDFVAKMNEKAQTIGMFNTKFADPTGLDDQETFSTASDLIKLMSYISKIDLILQTLKTKSMTVTSADGKITRRLVNTNRLLGENPGGWGKTGYTDGALGTIALAVDVNNGRDTIFGVILGSNDRFGEIKKLLEWSKKAYRWE